MIWSVSEATVVNVLIEAIWRLFVMSRPQFSIGGDHLISALLSKLIHCSQASKLTSRIQLVIGEGNPHIPPLRNNSSLHNQYKTKVLIQCHCVSHYQ